MTTPELDGITDAIELAIVTRNHSKVRDWQLVSLRRASDHVLAEVTMADTVVVDLVLAHRDGGWTVEICQPRRDRLLTDRFSAAFAYAFTHHADDRRKGTQIPYIAHLLGVTSLLLEMQSNSEDEAIAALLHDVVEDEGGMAAAAEILRQFGPDVLRIVLANSDTTVTPKPPSRERKEKYIAAIAAQGAGRTAGLAGRQAPQRPRDPSGLPHPRRSALGAVQRKGRGDPLVLPRARRRLR